MQGTLQLFGVGDFVRVVVETVSPGQTGNTSTFLNGHICVLKPEDTFQITRTRTRNGRTEFGVTVKDETETRCLVWLPDTNIAPVASA